MIGQYLDDVPERFRAELAAQWQRFAAVASPEDVKLLHENGVLQSLGKVWVSSRFIADSCLSDPSLLGELVRSGDLFTDSASMRYQQRLRSNVPDSEADLQRILRRFRRREMVRIAWRDIAGASVLAETLMDVSLLAETSIQFALDWIYQQACERHGPPMGREGEPLQMVVLGMGKLGAWELNYSSDIDLIFAIPEEGSFEGPKQTSFAEFFTRVGRRLIKALGDVTADGRFEGIAVGMRRLSEMRPEKMRNFDEPSVEDAEPMGVATITDALTQTT